MEGRGRCQLYLSACKKKEFFLDIRVKSLLRGGERLVQVNPQELISQLGLLVLSS